MAKLLKKAGQMPINNLGSKVGSTPPKRRTRQKEDSKNDKMRIGSDEHLLLAPTPLVRRTRNSELPQNSSIWQVAREIPPLGHISRKPQVHDITDHGEHRDSDSEDSESQDNNSAETGSSNVPSNVLDITDYKDDADIKGDTVIQAAIEEVRFQKTTLVSNPSTRLKFSFESQSEKAFISVNDIPECRFSIRNIKKVWFSETSVHFRGSDNNPFDDNRGQSSVFIHLVMSTNNCRKMMNIWRYEIREKLYLMEVKRYTDEEINALTQKAGRIDKAGFSSKNFSSLNKPGMKAKKNPASLDSSKPVKVATSPKSFYAPALDQPTRRTPELIHPHRFTRSVAKASSIDPITIDDVDELMRPRERKKKEPRVPFKPSLRHTFADGAVFTIKDSDYRCLEGSQWINDTLIDFFMKYFAEENTKSGLLSTDDFHVFSTFFFTRLTSSIDHYDNVKRWVSKVDLFRKDSLIIPINENLHWYGCIINNLKGLLTEDESCTVFVFDSLNQRHDSIITPIRNFLIGYAKDKHSLDVDPERINLKVGQVPKQSNFNDCGVHVIYNVSKFISQREECLEVWSKERVKRTELGEFFKTKDVKSMRERLRKILRQLQDEMKERGEVPPEDENDENSEDEDIVLMDADEFMKAQNEKSKASSESPKGEVSDAESPGTDGVASHMKNFKTDDYDVLSNDPSENQSNEKMDTDDLEKGTQKKTPESTDSLDLIKGESRSVGIRDDTKVPVEGLAKLKKSEELDESEQPSDSTKGEPKTADIDLDEQKKEEKQEYVVIPVNPTAENINDVQSSVESQRKDSDDEKRNTADILDISGDSETSDYDDNAAELRFGSVPVEVYDHNASNAKRRYEEVHSEPEVSEFLHEGQNTPSEKARAQVQVQDSQSNTDTTPENIVEEISDDDSPSKVVLSQTAFDGKGGYHIIPSDHGEDADDSEVLLARPNGIYTNASSDRPIPVDLEAEDDHNNDSDNDDNDWEKDYSDSKLLNLKSSTKKYRKNRSLKRGQSPQDYIVLSSDDDGQDGEDESEDNPRPKTKPNKRSFEYTKLPSKDGSSSKRRAVRNRERTSD